MFENLSSPHNVWIAIGLLGLILEVATGGFWMFFIGSAALLTGLLTYFDLLQSPELRLAFFAVISVVLMFTLRKPLLHVTHSKVGPATKDPAGDIVPVIRDISSTHPGQIEYQGSSWLALPEDPADIFVTGQNVRIVRQDGIRFFVAKA